MRLSSLVYFYRLRLRTRWVQELFALVGIAVGVALLFAGQVGNASLTGSVRQLIDGTFGLSELQLTARDPHGFEGRLLEDVRALPGVKAAAPLLEVHANVVGPEGRQSLTLLGADNSLARLDGRLTRRYRAARLPTGNLIALPAPIARAVGVPIGGLLQVEVGASTHRTRLHVELDQSEIGSLIHSPIAIAPLRYAQKLGAMRGRITRILVQPAAGQTDSVARGLHSIAGTGVDVRSADFDVTLFEQAAKPTSQSTALFAAISALVGFLFAFNAMLLTLGDRRNLVDALRIDGYSPSAVLQIVLFDAVVLGVTASLAGLALGDVISRRLFEVTPGYLSFAFAVGEQRVVGWQSVAIGVAGGIAAPMLAAALALRRGSDQRRATPAKRPGEISEGRTLKLLFGGLACLVTSVTLALAVPQAALPAIGLLVVALMLMLPAILFATLTLVTPLLKPVRSPVPLISLGELRSTPARSVALTATGALAVFGSVAILGARSDLQRGLDRSTRDVNAFADLWVSPVGDANMLATTPFSGDAARRIRAAPDVRAVQAYFGGFLDVGTRRILVVAPSRQSPALAPRSQLTQGDPEVTAQRLRGRGWIVVSEAVAATAHLHTGDRFTLPSPYPMSFRVAALSTNLGWPPGAVLLNAEDYQRAWGTHDSTALQVQLATGVPPDRGRAEVQQALGSTSTLSVETRHEREGRHHGLSRQALQRLSQLGTLVVIAAALAMAAATGGMVWQRRRRLASLKLDGFTTATVWRALLLESAVLLGTGCLSGALIGLCGQQMLDRALAVVTGFPVVHTVNVELALLSFALVTTIAVAIAGLPGYLAARITPSAAFQE